VLKTGRYDTIEHRNPRGLEPHRLLSGSDLPGHSIVADVVAASRRCGVVASVESGRRRRRSDIAYANLATVAIVYEYV